MKSFCLFLALAGIFYVPMAEADPVFFEWAERPPMGWNSYDAFGGSVTEEEVMANASYIKDRLLAHGWNYVVIDFRWYDAVSSYDDRRLNKERAGAHLVADAFGRLLPAPERFPSAADGKGFTSLASRLHGMGLKFGFHMMRGIPRQAAQAKTPIESSAFTAEDAANYKDICGWCPDMFGVRANEAGQAWYDAMFRLYASWGLDFIKVDDLSVPYHGEEMEMIRKAIDRCGRPIVFSASPGPTEIIHADHVSKLANMWRMSGDFWDRWKDLDHQFDLLALWQGIGGPGHWPDADMIPFGHIGIKATIAGKDRQSRFTPEERCTLMSLWTLASSPLMLGGHLPDNDEPTLALLTNDEVLAVNQDPLGSPAKRMAQHGRCEVWVKPLRDGSKAIGLFNRGDSESGVELDWAETGLTGKQTIRDLWHGQNLGVHETKYSASAPAHGCILLLVIPQHP